MQTRKVLISNEEEQNKVMEILNHIRGQNETLQQQNKKLQQQMQEHHRQDQANQSRVLRVVDDIRLGEHDMPKLLVMSLERKKDSISKDIAHALNPSNFGRNTWRLWFLDPITLRKAPTGEDGKGYKLKVQRQWLQKYGPALAVSFSVLAAAMKIGRVVGLQVDDVVTSASAGLGLGASQLTKSDIEDMRAICEVVNEMGGIAGSGEFLEGPSSAEACVSSRPVSRLTGEHYRLVKQIITEEVDPPDPALQRTGLVQAVAMPDRHIAWVLESDKEKFELEGLPQTTSRARYVQYYK